MYFIYRNYDVCLGIWLSRDYTENYGSNLYAYVNNSPINNCDDLGNKILIIEHKPGTLERFYINERRRRNKPVLPNTIRYIRNYYAFEVRFYQPPFCNCPDSGRGKISLGQKVNKSYLLGWQDDNHQKEYIQECCKHGVKHKVRRLPKYLSREEGIGGQTSVSYIDIPTGRINVVRKFQVQAICICPCDDDKVLETLEFTWDPLRGRIDRLE